MKADIKPYRTNFYMWHGVSAMFFSNCVTHVHSHNTMQIIVDLQGGFKCRTRDDIWQNHKNLIIDQNVVHQLDTNGSVQLLIYLDVETSAAKQIKARYMNGRPSREPDINFFETLNPKQLQDAILKTDPGLLLNVVNKILSILCGERDGVKADERILRILQMIAADHPEKLTVRYLAEQICLSQSRLRVLFKEATGMPVYKYMMWARIRFAINRIMNGYTVNEAALEACFTDSSHFHKMMISMFGISPSQFIKSSQFFNIITCDNSPLNFETSVYNKFGELEKVYR
ncbi:MAG TPA: AraC family transcriptional regulator [Mucilaginibacter sp.]|nr:AraC family transcriptional regulator [Mucilaginibacter sp.]